MLSPDREPDHEIAGPVRYAVLAHPVDHELEVKRSRFLCRVRRVADETEARSVIAEARDEHRMARHHCTAFLLRPDRRVRRSSDDGEPAGTAGAPMLEALTLHDVGLGDAQLSDVVAVVTRYFGGVLLGAGGLVRAYSDAVLASLDRARFQVRERRAVYALEAPHADAGRWEHELRSAGVVLLDSEYGARDVRLQLTVTDTESERAALAARIAALTQGARSLEPLGERWVDLDSPPSGT